MEPVHKPQLYRWERISKPTLKSRPVPKNNLATDDVEAWIKKVEEASEFAVAETFGNAKRHRNTRNALLTTVDQLHDHDAAFDEAQQILSDWVTNKLNVVDDHTENNIWNDEDDSPVPSHAADPSPLQQIIQQEDAGAISMEEYDRLVNIDLYNEEAVVEDVLDQMRRKEVVKPDFFKDLGDIGGMDTNLVKKKDPRIKMTVRQNQVKENREKRREELLKKRDREQAKQEAMLLAKHQAAEVRKKKIDKSKREEAEIQREMNRIRKELQEERRQQLRKQNEERELELRMERLAREQAQVAASQQESEKLASACTEAEHHRKKKIMHSIQVAELNYAAISLKLKRKYFSTWFDVVLEKRMQSGKAKAVFDWKCMFRAWNAWRSFTRQKVLDREKAQHEHNMVADHRKHHMAAQHHRISVLKNCFFQWQLWLSRQQAVKESEKNQVLRQNKMASFLVTASKKLEPQQHTVEPSSPVPGSSQQNLQVDAMFNGEAKKSTLNNLKTVSGLSNSRRKTKLREAWQVTRKHVQCTKQNHNAFSGGGVDESEDAFEAALKLDIPSSSHKTSPVPKGFENRFAAQQKILLEQQKAIKEQKRMIDDLKFQQDRKLLEEQVEHQKKIQEQLEKLTKLTLVEKARDLQLLEAKGRESKSDDNHALQSLPITARSESTAVSSGSSVKANSFYKKMQERAEERAKAKQEREKRRRQQAELQVFELEAKEEENYLKEQEEKKQRLEAYKQKKRLEKQRELDKQRLKEKMSAQLKLADEHSRLRTMKFYGFYQLKAFNQHCKVQETAARLRYENQLQKRFYAEWHRQTEAILVLKYTKADNFHRKHLMMRCFRNWTRWRHQNQILMQKAERFYKSHLVSALFKAWLDITTSEKIEMWEKERHARHHDILRLKQWTLNTWRQLPIQKKKEREAEKRKQDLRRKVTSLLPDFNISS